MVEEPSSAVNGSAGTPADFLNTIFSPFRASPTSSASRWPTSSSAASSPPNALAITSEAHRKDRRRPAPPPELTGQLVDDNALTTSRPTMPSVDALSNRLRRLGLPAGSSGRRTSTSPRSRQYPTP